MNAPREEAPTETTAFGGTTTGRERLSGLPAKDRSIGAFGNIQDDGLVAACFMEVFVKLQAQLANVYPDGAVLNRTVVRGLMEERVANVLFG